MRPWYSFVLAALSGTGLWAFIVLFAEAKLVIGPVSLIPVLACFVIFRPIRFAAVRALLEVTVTFGYMYSSFSHQSFRTVIAGEWTDISILFTKHQLLDPLESHVALIGLVLVFEVLYFCGLRKRLWILVNSIALVGAAGFGSLCHLSLQYPLITVATVFLLGLVLLRYERARETRSTGVSGAIRFLWPVLTVGSLVVLLPAILPKYNALLRNPFFHPGHPSSPPVIRRVQIIGYQLDNTKLGGSFTPNKTVVMSVVSTHPAYIRGNVYETYTGKGWTEAPSLDSVAFRNEVPQAAQQSFGASIRGTTVRQRITVLTGTLPRQVVFGAYSIRNISMTRPPKSVSGASEASGGVLRTGEARFSLDRRTGTVSANRWNWKNEIYTVTSMEPNVADFIPSGRTMSAGGEFVNLKRIPVPIRQADLQLPGHLPESVRALAKQVTGGAKTEYDAVRAVENYLTTHYTYSNVGVPQPAADQDYVEQFLFQSKKGYCNNFSSSMAAMLRAVGIPTRWVTGFTEGTPDPRYSGPGQRYLITNADAHSWVEVYFPSVGWIPFDTTPGYVMPDPATTPGPSVSVPLWHRSYSIAAVCTLLLLCAGLCVLGLRRNRSERRQWGIDGLASPVFGAYRRLATHESRENPQGRFLPPIGEVLGELYRNGEISEPTGTIRDLEPVALKYHVSQQDFTHLVRTVELSYYGNSSPLEEDLVRAKMTWEVWMATMLPGKTRRHHRNRHNSAQPQVMHNLFR